jgi:hypothetical protein
MRGDGRRLRRRRNLPLKDGKNPSLHAPPWCALDTVLQADRHPAILVVWTPAKFIAWHGETRRSPSRDCGYTLRMGCSIKRREALGPTIQSKPDFCPLCDGRRIIKARLAQEQFSPTPNLLLQGLRPVLFVPSWTERRQYPPRVIARVLCLYNLGHSQEEAARRIASEHRITVPRRTISDWISGYRSITAFHRLRAAAIHEFGDSMLKERTLEHQQVYQYKVHLAKLAFLVDAVPADVAAKVKKYLLSILGKFSRCSVPG